MNRPALGFTVSFIADGVSKTIAFSLATGPFLLAVGTSAQISAGFLLSTTLPVAAINLSSSDGQTPTQGIAAGVITFTYPNAPTAGKVDIAGDFEF